MSLGVLAVTGGYTAAEFICDVSEETSLDLIEKGFSQASSYRFVRFLPDYMNTRFSNKRVSLCPKEKEIKKPFLSPQEHTKVSFYYLMP